MVPVDSVGVPRDPTYSGTSRETSCFHLRDCHPLWSDFPDSSVSRALCNSHVRGPTTPQRKTSAVWAISRSLAATEEIDFSFFSCGYLDVSVHRVGCIHLWIQCMPVRESRDQHSFDSSPELFAVFHALQRLLAPRHPPCALSSLATFIQPSRRRGFRKNHRRQKRSDSCGFHHNASTRHPRRVNDMARVEASNARFFVDPDVYVPHRLRGPTRRICLQR